MANRIFLILSFYILLNLLYVDKILAESIIVFDVRKNLALGPNDPVYRDYYINAGTEVGLKVGLIVTVERRIPLHNTLTNKSQGELVVPVAKLKVIFVNKKVSVARFYSTMPRTNLPAVEYNTIMAGDELNMSTASVEIQQEDKVHSEISEPMVVGSLRIL